MPRYDASRYNPPAPVAFVSLQRSGGQPLHDVPLLIDTGADVTLIPRWAVARVGGTPEASMKYEVFGFDGNRSLAEAVDLEMIFLNKIFRGRYLLTEEEHGILGRDILMILRLLFDGPAQEWSEMLPCILPSPPFSC